MPKTKNQAIVFGILMSFFMALGMEVYNVSIQMGYNLTFGLGYSSITYAVFAAAPFVHWIFEKYNNKSY